MKTIRLEFNEFELQQPSFLKSFLRRAHALNYDQMYQRLRIEHFNDSTSDSINEEFNVVAPHRTGERSLVRRMRRLRPFADRRGARNFGLRALGTERIRFLLPVAFYWWRNGTAVKCLKREFCGIAKCSTTRRNSSHICSKDSSSVSLGISNELPARLSHRTTTCARAALLFGARNCWHNGEFDAVDVSVIECDRSL